MELARAAVYKKVPEGYIAFVEELPGPNTQGKTLEGARENPARPSRSCSIPIVRWPAKRPAKAK